MIIDIVSPEFSTVNGIHIIVMEFSFELFDILFSAVNKVF